MLRSMTGYGRKENLTEGGSLIWEIRAVNHRYLELGFRMPEECRAIEPRARELLGKQLKRGKVDAALKFSNTSTSGSSIVINDLLAEQIIEAAAAVSAKLEKPAAIDPLKILSWPGVTGAPVVDAETLHKDALSLLSAALDDFIESREREGEKTQAMIEERVDSIERLVGEARTLRPAIVARLQDKMRARLEALDLDIDSGRLEQELAMMAQKLDVDEELDRLGAHVAEIRDIFKRKEPVGRRLDFLIQEFNREANTLGSKAADSDTTGISVELKVLIEQIREQVQNIE